MDECKGKWKAMQAWREDSMSRIHKKVQPVALCGQRRWRETERSMEEEKSFSVGRSKSPWRMDVPSHLTVFFFEQCEDKFRKFLGKVSWNFLEILQTHAQLNEWVEEMFLQNPLLYLGDQAGKANSHMVTQANPFQRKSKLLFFCLMLMMGVSLEFGPLLPSLSCVSDVHRTAYKELKLCWSAVSNDLE